MNSAQVAVLTERIEYIARTMEDIKPLITAIATMRVEQDSMAVQVRQLAQGGEVRLQSIHAHDKRILILERWHKAMIGFGTVAVSILLAMAGYTKSFIETIQNERNDTNQRLSNLELIVNSPNYSKAMELPRQTEVVE